MPSLAEVAGAQRRSSSTAGAKGSSRRVIKPPLKVLPIFIWSPPAQNATPSPPMRGDAGSDRFGVEVGEDSLLTNAELAAEAISSILRDSNLKKVDACALRRLWPYRFREPSPYIQAPSFIRLNVVLMLSANSILFLIRRLLI